MKKLGNKIVYELYPISFYDSNNDGIGDVKGIIEKLDYLALLGIDLIWITPIFKSPKNDNGYDIANYFEIDPMFGTMEEVETLIKEGKKRNISIMFDMVFNHVSTESEWYKKALLGDEKYKDYFYIIKSDDKNNPPTNCVSKFGGSAWEYKKEFGGYYLHLFDKSQIDIKWKNEQVREELVKVLNFWLEKGIGGFRFDVINLIGKPDKWIDTPDFGKSLYTDHPDVHNYLKEINEKSFGKYKNIITVGEMSSTTIENCIKYTNPEEKELDMVFNFHHLKVDYKDGQKWENKPWDKKEFKYLIKEWQSKMDGKGWNAVFLNNHDQPRINSRYGNVDQYWFESSTLFAILIFTLQGTPFIYQGEEIGMTNPDFSSIKEYKDVESINAFNELKVRGKKEEEIMKILAIKSRDNSRSPMQWNSSENAGFSKTNPWINVAKNYKQINVENQIKDENSVFNFYRKLIKLRKEMPELYEGKINFIDIKDENIFVYERTYENNKVLIVLNLSDQEISLNLEIDEKNIILNNCKQVVPKKLLPLQGIVVKK